MNTGKHTVKNKKVYAIGKMDPVLVSYLEGRTGKKLTKLKLESKPGQGFWRWKLEGIKDSTNGYYKYASLFEEMVPELEYLLGDSLVWVLKYMSEGGVLGIDLKKEEDIYQRVPQEKVDFVMSDEFLDWREERYPRGSKPKLIQLYWYK